MRQVHTGKSGRVCGQVVRCRELPWLVTDWSLGTHWTTHTPGTRQSTSSPLTSSSAHRSNGKVAPNWWVVKLPLPRRERGQNRALASCLFSHWLHRRSVCIDLTLQRQLERNSINLWPFTDGRTRTDIAHPDLWLGDTDALQEVWQSAHLGLGFLPKYGKHRSHGSNCSRVSFSWFCASHYVRSSVSVFTSDINYRRVRCGALPGNRQSISGSGQAKKRQGR